MTFSRFVRQKLGWYLIALLIIASGFIGFRVMGEMKTPVQATPPEPKIPTVQVETFDQAETQLSLHGQGFVTPLREIQLAAQSPGQIVELAPAIERQGTITKGQVLARLDDRSARANVKSAQANLDLVLTQLKRAQELRRSNTLSQGDIDQLNSQKEQLEAALEAAQIQLDNTEIRAPFSGRVLSSNVRAGSVISAGQPIAVIYTDTQLEVPISIPEREANLIPGLFSAQPKAEVTVHSTFGQQTATWPARIERVSRQIDPRTRMLPITIAVDESVDNPFPLLPNSFVQVEIRVSDNNLMALPASALQPGATVWQVQDDTLAATQVMLAYRDQSQVFVQQTPELVNAQIVISPLANPQVGQTVEIIE